MADINSGAGAGEALIVDPVSFAARASLYDAAGGLVIRQDREYTSAPSGVLMSGMNDSSAVNLRVDRSGNIGLSAVVPLIWEEWENTVLPNRWTHTNTTFAPTYSGTGVNMNPTSLTTASAVSVLISNRTVLRMGRNLVQYKSRGRVTNFANSQNDFGFADAVSGTAQIANGVYFQITTAGVVQAVITVSSTDNATPIVFLSGYPFDGTKTYTWDITMDDESASFFVQETITGRIVGRASLSLSNTGARLFAATHLKAFNRVFNTATPPATAPINTLHYMFVGFIDTNYNKPWQDILAGNYQGTVHSPVAVGGVAQWANSAEPASATLSNTAAGYTTLGGKFQFAAVAGAVTDFALFGFTVPAPYSLHVKSITIDLWNTGAAVATTPTVCTWGAMVDSTAVSLATANMPRRFIGSQSLAIGTVVGGMAQQIVKQFNVPLVTHSGRFFVIILRMPIGTATASQVVAGSIDIDGYFE